MEAVFEAQDLGAGFSIAMKDLEIRGTGNLLGAEQSGHATAIGFDLYTRMIGEAVERLRGVPWRSHPPSRVNLPLSDFCRPSTWEARGNASPCTAASRRWRTLQELAFRRGRNARPLRSTARRR